MQNVSQALIIAGSVILGVILMATLVYVLRIGGSVNKAYDEKQQSYQTEAFNYQYEVYQRDDNNIIDMVTLLNLAYSANIENNYDVNNSVIIILKIGNKTYRTPKDISTNSETFYNNNYKALERNQVYCVTDNKIMSVYDLINKPINQTGTETLGISGILGTEAVNPDKLSKIHIGKYVYYPDRKVSDSKRGEPEIGDSGTTYKYVFDCDDSSITYNKTTGKISKMEFECKINPYWELGNFYTEASLTAQPDWD